MAPAVREFKRYGEADLSDLMDEHWPGMVVGLVADVLMGLLLVWFAV